MSSSKGKNLLLDPECLITSGRRSAVWLVFHKNVSVPNLSAPFFFFLEVS